MKGQIIKKYTLTRRLTEDEIAEVWAAESNIGIKAIVKILKHTISKNEVVSDQFENSARRILRLTHPNIQKLYDYEIVDSRPAFILESLSGETLAGVLTEEQQYTNEQLMQWWDQLVETLRYTHNQGMIHGDIHPNTLIITKDKQVKITEFGLSTLGDTLNQKKLDARSDIYDLALTFYSLTTLTDPNGLVNGEKPNLTLLPFPWNIMLPPLLDKNPDKRPALKLFAEIELTKTEHLPPPPPIRTKAAHVEPKTETAAKQPKPTAIKEQRELYYGDDQRKTTSSNSKKAKLAIIFIGLVGLMEIILFFVAIGYNNVYHEIMEVEIKDTGFLSEAQCIEVMEQNFSKLMTTVNISLLIFSLSVFFFLRWFKAVYHNLHQKESDLSYSEGWSILSWFIPILNLFAPYQIMKDLVDRAKKSLQTQMIFTSGIVILWWIIFILDAILAWMFFLWLSINENAYIESTEVGTLILKTVVGILLALISMKLINEYDRAEKLINH